LEKNLNKGNNIIGEKNAKWGTTRIGVQVCFVLFFEYSPLKKEMC
jgi:hypothetical protein